MRTVYCWRCKNDVPMLTEREYASFTKAYEQCLLEAKEVRRRTGKPVSDPEVQGCFAPVAQLYTTVTGLAGVDPQEVMRHRLLLVGPACAQCGRPLRTAKARCCAACGAKVKRGAT